MKEMQNITEIRDVRRRISERFGHDPARLVKHYMDLQEERDDAGKPVKSSSPRLVQEDATPYAGDRDSTR